MTLPLLSVTSGDVREFSWRRLVILNQLFNFVVDQVDPCNTSVRMYQDKMGLSFFNNFFMTVKFLFRVLYYKSALLFMLYVKSCEYYHFKQHLPWSQYFVTCLSTRFM